MKTDLSITVFIDMRHTERRRSVTLSEDHASTSLGMTTNHIILISLSNITIKREGHKGNFDRRIGSTDCTNKKAFHDEMPFKLLPIFL